MGWLAVVSAVSPGPCLRTFFDLAPAPSGWGFLFKAKGAAGRPFCSDDAKALSSVRFAPIATHEPVGAVAYSDEWKAGANERARHTTRFVTATSSIALTKSVPIAWISERRNREGSKHSRGDNQFFHLSLPEV